MKTKLKALQILNKGGKLKILLLIYLNIGGNYTNLGHCTQIGLQM